MYSERSEYRPQTTTDIAGQSNFVESTVGKIPTIRAVDVRGKRVKLRGDYDADFADPDAIFKVSTSKPSVDYLFMHGISSLEIFGHVGRPNGIYVEKLSTKHLVKILSNILQRNIIHESDVVKGHGIDRGTILLKENTRFDPREELNDDGYAQELARDGDIFIDDAFATSHRGHASNTGITKFIRESVCGLWMEKELAAINKLKSRPRKNFGVIIGGSKIDTKVEFVNEFASIAGWVFLTGLLSDGYKKAGYENPGNIILSTNNEEGIDMSKKSMKEIRELILEKAEEKTIFWNGPAGLESTKDRPLPERGTVTIARNMAYVTINPNEYEEAYTYVGGGNTVTSVSRKGYLVPRNYSHVSVGGGAGQEYSIGRKSPALVVLRK